MEDIGDTVSSLSELINRGRPLTATSSLVPHCEISSPERQRNSSQSLRRKPYFSTCQNPSSQTLKPLNQPTVLVGTLTLPSLVDHKSPIICNCFQFYDDSSTVCCEILDFDSKMVGKKIRVVAWNFIPFKCRDGGAKSGLLEIIGWEFVHACSDRVCTFLDFSSVCFTLGPCVFKENRKVSSLIFGVVESISPAFVAPHASRGGEPKDTWGFLVNVLICPCNFCRSRLGASELKTMSEKTMKDHSFGEPAILYFSGLASSWHPVVSRFIGDIVLLTGVQKKMVFITKGESRLTYVTTDEVSLHIPRLFKGRQTCTVDTKKKGEGRSYTGVVTGVYMQGMVVELDQNVILLITDQHLTVPHSVRVGAIVTVKNAHLVDPKFPWGKILILGACYRTSVHVEFFSPLETGCHQKAHSQSLLQKFINSLSFPARLWTLLLVSSFKKKFAGVVSKKEILGSKHTPGLAQKYANGHLSPSAFQHRGVLVEFFKHDMCSRVRGGHCDQLKLVLSIADLISYCETSWKKILEYEKNTSGFVDGINQKRLLSCGGRSYFQSIKRVLHSEEIGVHLLGTLKISSISGRMQLVDATGGLDIILDLPAMWDFDKIFEVRGFTLIMEGIPPKLAALDSSIYPLLSCQSIFSKSLPSRRTETSIYLYQRLSDEDTRSCSIFFDWKRICQGLDSGKFHLLMLMHKYPVQRKFQGDLVKKSNMFAEAIVMPWDLLITGKCGDAGLGMLSSAQHWSDSLDSFYETGEFVSEKRSKTELGSGESSSLKDPRNGFSVHSNSLRENSYPCLIASKYASFHWLGMLQCTNGHAKIDSDFKAPRKNVLLEFGPDRFSTYEALKIGHCYLIKHQENDVLCSIRGNCESSRTKVFLCTKSYLWSLTFASIESLKFSDASEVLPCCNFHTYSSEVLPKKTQQSEIPPLTCNGIDNEVSADNKIFVPSSALTFLKNISSTLHGDLMETRDSLQQEPDAHGYNSSTVKVSMQSLGNSYSDYPFPQGNLITLHGLVSGLHAVNCDTFPGSLDPTASDGYLPKFLQGSDGICIHVLAANEIVKILCDRSKHHYPVGLGKDAYATFHRVLFLGRNSCMMMPVSFITINNTNSANAHPDGDLNCSSGNVGSPSVASSNTVWQTLISDALQLSENKPMQFRCRVVGIYVLVLEKARETSVSHSSAHSVPSVGIPFVGFFMDDGSSCCCCWANSEVAATLLQLEFRESLLEHPVKTLRSTACYARLPFTSTVSKLNKILEYHGRIVVKNCGPSFDPLCQELAFFVESDRLIGSSDENLVRSMVTNAIVSNSWTITGSRMDLETMSWLEEQLTVLDMAVPPLPNILARSVCGVDTLMEARNLLLELV
ncbi:CST complex subunit CTC1 isoform X2 [Andrographis paniculata]|uniref:CST complex subunit CTC1 isoform X2 n=1 Tax=Andrographis paniculata TaxID=175694 RepID=UPI0021E81BE9|nr:CST complex subunit CTC1 isoform X2 [Andrographis paniculata]